MKTQHLLPFFLSLILSASSFAQQPDIVLDTFANGFTAVTDISNAGDERLFVVEQAGVIHILNPDGSTNSTPFLDITSIVEDEENEQGLLGLTFHPNYDNNGYLYVNYTAPPNGDTHISRFTVSPADSNLADPGSEVVLLTREQPYGNHNAGDLNFGPDGYLYFGLGDGGDGGDPLEQGQDSTTLLGKMLRIDVDGGSPYAIPPSNPFVSDTSALDEIWALGLRNPWRFSFDAVTGDMWIADVGQNQYEEINVETAGGNGGLNWGWDCYEANHEFEPQDCGPASNYNFPVYEYAHGAVHCSVTGGFVYRGSVYPDLHGHYVFADLCSGHFWTLYENGSGGYDTTDQGVLANGLITTFGEDMEGELYVAERSNYIYKVTTNYTTASDNPHSASSFLMTSPNPFSENTVIKFKVEEQSRVQLNVFDNNGNLVSELMDDELSPGIHSHKWNTSKRVDTKLPNGVYHIVLTTENGRYHNKVVILQ